MGKAPRWLSKLLRRKKSPLMDDGSQATTASSKDSQHLGAQVQDFDGIDIRDPSKHAIAVAAATAAVAEAAIAAARAAAEVVRLTSGRAGSGGFRQSAVEVGGGGGGRVEVSASGRKLSLEDIVAVKIQSAFRGYLARKALKALRGLVKLQALVRGYLVRKQSSDMLRRMQAMFRLQERARANRLQGQDFTQHVSEYQRSHNLRTDDSSSVLKRSIAASRMTEVRMAEQAVSGASLLDNLMESSQRSMKIKLLDDDKTDKILEVDSWKPHLKPNRGRSGSNISSIDYHVHSFAASDALANYLTSNLQEPTGSPFSDLEVSSMRSLNFPPESCAAESSPHAFFVTSRPACGSRGPRRNASSTSFLGGYLEGHPKYMSNTESSQAKIRCQSAPRQRPEAEKRHMISKSSFALQDPKPYSRRGSDQDANSMGKLYSGSGRVDRVAIPIQYDTMGYNYSCK